MHPALSANIGRSRLPGPFEATIFTRRVTLAASSFIHAMHPKTEIRATREAIAKVLARGWVAQAKIHGHRAQIHLSADPEEPPIAYNRQGRRHAMPLPPAMVRELRRLFQPARGWSALDAEWLKPRKKLFVFDILKQEDKVLSSLTFPERHQLLPRLFISPSITVLPILDDVEKCLKLLETEEPEIEGIVLKAGGTRGFHDSSIIRCRRPERRH
jgi:hypothetical protein